MLIQLCFRIVNKTTFVQFLVSHKKMNLTDLMSWSLPIQSAFSFWPFPFPTILSLPSCLLNPFLQFSILHLSYSHSHSFSCLFFSPVLLFSYNPLLHFSNNHFILPQLQIHLVSDQLNSLSLKDTVKLLLFVVPPADEYELFSTFTSELPEKLFLGLFV